MDKGKIADLFIDVGFEPEHAWKLAHLAVKPHKDRTDEENKLIAQALKQVRDNTSKLFPGYVYVGKIEAELHEQDLFNEILSRLQEGQKQKYRQAGCPYGDTEEGLAKWQAELE